MVALFAGTLALLSLLLLATGRETEVELNLVASELRFTLAARQQLSEPLQLESLGAGGPVNAALPGSLTDAIGAAQVRFQAARTPSGGKISLAPLVGAAGAEVTL